VGARRNGRAADEVKAGIDAGMGGVACPEQFIRQSGRECGDSGNLPAFKNPADEPGAETRSPAPQWNAVEIVDDQAMAGIDAGIAAFLGMVKLVYGVIPVSNRG